MRLAKARRSPKRRRKIPGDAQDVSRSEFANIETVVRGNAEHLTRLDSRLDAISQDIAELARIVSSLRPKS